MLLNDRRIIEYCERGMITPFERSKIRAFKSGKAISFGCSGHGYDIRLSAQELKIARPDVVIDPKNAREDWFYEPELITSESGTYFELPGNAYALARTVEAFNMPENVFAIAVGKSTYARAGLVANITPIEAGWRGILTLELNNNHRAAIRVYVNEGIAQLIFFDAEPPLQGAYNGAYQDQKGTTVSTI